MSTPDLDAIQARADAATGGPWETTMSNDDYPPITYGVITATHGDAIAELADDVRSSIQEGPMSSGSADSWFIAAARTDVPALLAYARDLEARIGRAWDEGFDRGFYDPLAGSDRDASESPARNPYRVRGEA